MADHQQQQQRSSSSSSSTFKTEVHVPVRRDNQTFEQRQKNMWEEMNERMEKRRREWEDEVDQLRSDFFRLRPEETHTLTQTEPQPQPRGGGSGGGGGGGSGGGGGGGSGGGSDNLLERMDLNSMFYDTGKGTRLFRVSFDVSQFQPHEISVRTQNQNLIVHAKHEEKGSDKSVSREFSRQVVIPNNVNPETLRSTLSNDGILQVEAEMPAPSYDQLRDDRARIFSMVTGATTPRDVINAGQQRAVTTGQDGGSKFFQLTVDIGPDFLPQDLTVKTVDRKLVVRARHEEKAPGRTSCREFNREFDIPEDVDPNVVTASLTAGGKLVIEAPLIRATAAPPAAAGAASGGGSGGQVKQPAIHVSHGGI